MCKSPFQLTCSSKTGKFCFNGVANSSSNSLPLRFFKNSLVKKISFDQTPGKTSDLLGDQPVTFGKQLPTINEMKGLLVEEALRRSSGNKSLAAEMLGTTRQVFYWQKKSQPWFSLLMSATIQALPSRNSWGVRISSVSENLTPHVNRWFAVSQRAFTPIL